MFGKVLVMCALVLSIAVPFIIFNRGEKTSKRYKKYLGMNVALFFGILLISSMVLFGTSVSAAESASVKEEGVTSASGMAVGMGYLAAALVTGLSCIGGGIAVSSSASAALGAISENPNLLGKSLIFVGLAEGVCLYGLIISFMILGKI